MQAGFRSFDGATIYGTEEGLGRQCSVSELDECGWCQGRNWVILRGDVGIFI